VTAPHKFKRGVEARTTNLRIAPPAVSISHATARS